MMDKIKEIVFLILTLLIFLPVKSEAKIINATSGSSKDVRTAVNAATAGDTVMVPAGQFSFDESVKISAGLTILGAGIDKTILQKSTSSTKFMFDVDGSNGRRITIGGITFIGVDSGTSDSGIKLNNGCKNFRIFNCTFKKFNRSGITIRGNANGVIDHCSFIDNYLRGYGYGVEVYGSGDENWNRPLTLGTENSIFVEDSYFTGNRHCIASNNGSRYVFRYNQIVDNREDAAAIDAHGLSSWPRGSRSYEIYENVIDNSIKRWAGIGIRGGDGVIFNNVMVRGITNPIILWNDGGNNCYPCKDQIRELYIWNNTYQGSPATVDFWQGGEQVIKENREYFLTSRPDYTPFTYPHPLVTGEINNGGDVQSPSPPQNLRVEQD